MIELPGKRGAEYTIDQQDFPPHPPADILLGTRIFWASEDLAGWAVFYQRTDRIPITAINRKDGGTIEDSRGLLYAGEY